MYRHKISNNVKSLIQETEYKCSDSPKRMTKKDAKLLTTMTITRLVEFLQSHCYDKDQIGELLLDSVEANYNEIDYTIKTLLIDFVNSKFDTYKFDKTIFSKNLSMIDNELNIGRPIRDFCRHMFQDSLTKEMIDNFFDKFPEANYNLGVNNHLYGDIDYDPEFEIELPFTNYYHIEKETNIFVDVWYYYILSTFAKIKIDPNNIFENMGNEVDLNKLFDKVHGTDLRKKNNCYTTYKFDF